MSLKKKKTYNNLIDFCWKSIPSILNIQNQSSTSISTLTQFKYFRMNKKLVRVILSLIILNKVLDLSLVNRKNKIRRKNFTEDNELSFLMKLIDILH